MTLTALNIPPGVWRNGTQYQGKGRWKQSQLVRFIEGTKQPVGGWETLQTSAGADVSFTGVCRKLLGWSFGQAPTLAIGTHNKLFTFTQGVITDRTPSSFTPGAIDTETSTGQYGSGNYGAGNYGEGDPAQSAVTEAGSWQIDTFGNFLVGVHNIDGQLVFWDTVASLAVEPTATSGSVPVSNVGVVVTPERFVVVLGANGDDRLLQWPDRESLVKWDPTEAGSSAGDYPLAGQGKLMTGERGKNETLIWTDQDLWAMQFIGGALVYSVKTVGTKCGIISRHAKAVVDGRAIWMGQRGFFTYDGFVKPVASEVSDYIFGDFNRTQRAKCFAFPLPHFGEVWFFYCSAVSSEPDRYVIFNYLENHWSTGDMTRTAGIDRGAFEYPMMADTTRVYDHERGTSRTGVTAPFLESGPVEIGDGDQIIDVTGMVPDESTSAGQVLGSTTAKFFVTNHPDEAEVEFGPFTMANPTDVRLSARQIRMRIDELVEGDWRVGEPRLDMQPGSRR